MRFRRRPGSGPRSAAGAVLLGSSLVLLVPGPASAHVEVSAPGAVAGDGPVTLLFVAESESADAGVVSLHTQLPSGLAAGDVALVSGPPGWSLIPTTEGFEVAGPELPVGEDVTYAVVVGPPPADGTDLVLKTVQRYADGREDAWIELPTQAVPEPRMPAPTLSLEPASGAAVPVVPAAEAPDAAEDDGTGALLGAGALLALASFGSGVWFWRSRAAGAA